MRTNSLFASPPDLSPALRHVRKHMLARMGLAWLIMMQVMMLAFPGYLRGGRRSADAQHFLDQAIILMNWSSLILCVPLILYCAWPIWLGASRNLSRLRIGMDVPVALSLIAAFIPSVIATWRDYGEVYYDSASMFVAFLLTARFLETSARQALVNRKPYKIDQQLLNYADKFALWFVLIQITITIAVGIYWWQVQPENLVPVTVALLVMSCPCALSMAVPSALAARQAIMLKNPDLLAIDSINARMVRISKQSLYGSLVWHVLMTPLAAIGLVQPWLAAISMLVSSAAVAVNAWRLSKYDLYQDLNLATSAG